MLLKCTECVISDELITLISSGEKLNPTRGPMSTDMSRVKFAPNWKAWIWTCTSFRSSWEANSCWNREVKFVKELEVFSIWKATSIGYTHWQAEFDESGRTIMLVVQHPGWERRKKKVPCKDLTQHLGGRFCLFVKLESRKQTTQQKHEFTQRLCF